MISKFRPYYKTRIIIIFSAIAMVIVIVMSLTGYTFVRNIYITQLSEQANVVSEMISRQIEKNYLDVLELGMPTPSVKAYFNEIFKKNLKPALHSEIFIFNEDFKIIVHSNPAVNSGESEPRLLLNQLDISALKIHSGTSSLPFKGDDGNWYLWGFFRLNESLWLAVRESAVQFKKLNELSNIFFLIGLFGVLLTAGVSWFAANKVTKPLQRLIKFSSEIGKGNFSARTPEKLYGEIKLLSDSMDEMRKDLAINQKEKENLLAQIAHEIRNPLGGIELLSNLSKENLECFDDELDPGTQGSLIKKNKEYLDKILKEVHGLKLLITSYLNYSRPNTANPVSVDLPKLFFEIENVFKTALQKHEIKLKFELQLKTFWFDESHLKQILLNLVGNSVEAYSARKNSGSSPREVVLSAREENGSGLISVIDNGPGIAEENLKFIFNPFFTTKKNGT
ncbi:MAG TPA: ATP-binding protein, partial [Ignavibacteriaceae bacterium]|nr:ATP-binding protein [Ignavibacteriaceae bacterium]